jgi:hypothetical protein
MNYADTAFGGGCVFADNGGAATVGIQVAGNQGTEFSFNTPSVSGGTSLLWTLVGPPSPPAISVTPPSQEFGTVTVGSSADRSFTVQNAGGGTLSGSASIAAPYAVISGGSFSLGAGASQQVTVRFTPTAPGSAPGDVSFTSNAGILSRSVTGIGALPPTISVTPPSQDFGTVAVDSSTDRSFTVQNTGGGTLSGSASIAAPYAVISGGSFSLGAGASQQVTVRFTPTAPGSAAGNVSFTSNAGNVGRSVTGIGAASTAQITVTSPGGGEAWRENQKRNIRWTSSGVSGTVRIDLSRDGGASREILFASVPNDGTQSWRVTKPASTQAQIRVCDQSLTICDTSTFTIKERRQH